MRVVKELLHPEMKMTIFSWNEKYILKLEKGNFEQTFKFGVDEVNGGVEGIVKNLRGEFLKSAISRFKEMEESIKLTSIKK